LCGSFDGFELPLVAHAFAECAGERLGQAPPPLGAAPAAGGPPSSPSSPMMAMFGQAKPMPMSKRRPDVVSHLRVLPEPGSASWFMFWPSGRHSHSLVAHGLAGLDPPVPHPPSPPLKSSPVSPVPPPELTMPPGGSGFRRLTAGAAAAGVLVGHLPAPGGGTSRWGQR
jgi:hypothetical protein